MQCNDWHERILDILESVDRIENYTDGLSFDEFDDNQLVVDAVIRNFTVIGEAARMIPDEVKEKHPDIPWREMRDFRNFVVHNYLGISNRVLWNTIRIDLPVVQIGLQKIIKKRI